MNKRVAIMVSILALVLIVLAIFLINYANPPENNLLDCVKTFGERFCELNSNCQDIYKNTGVCPSEYCKGECGFGVDPNGGCPMACVAKQCGDYDVYSIDTNAKCPLDMCDIKVNVRPVRNECIEKQK